MEIRVQVGGLLGLARLLNVAVPEQPSVEDVHRLLSEAQKKYGTLDDLPYSGIIQSVVQFQGRRRRQR